MCPSKELEAEVAGSLFSGSGAWTVVDSTWIFILGCFRIGEFVDGVAF